MSLRLHLLIARPNDSVPSRTPLPNVFVCNKQTHAAVELAIRSGVFGHHSKSCYRLVGRLTVWLEDGSDDVTDLDFPFFRKVAGRSPHHVRDVPSVLQNIL